MVQDKINSFNAAFIDLAAAYVRRMANKIAGNETYTAEPPAGPLRWGNSLADEMRVVNLLAATIGKMQAASGGELPQGGKANPAADDLEQLREFLEGKRRWGFPKGTKINVTIDESGISAMETTGPEPVNMTPGAWELARDILAGKRPAPEGTVFDVVIDMTGNPQAIRRREEPEPAPRMLALSMPGGEVVKLNSAAEAYGLAACIEKMAASVWPEAGKTT